MGSMKRTTAFLLLLLVFLSPCAAWADGDKENSNPSGDDSLISQEAEERSPKPFTTLEEGLRQQIRDTYAAAKQRSRRKSFKGYCGAYVANQLVVLGINTTCLSANGNNTYDIYKNMEVTSGGFLVSAYSAKEYTLAEALSAIIRREPAATNILVGFQKGTSKAGKKYGHVLFIHGIRNGKIFYSDSCARTVDDVQYKEGEPIACSLATFLEQYAGYTLDGVIHFRQPKEVAQEPSVEETISTSSENLVSAG